MSNENEASQDKAVTVVQELFKILIATSGIILALLWGLAKNNLSGDVYCLIRCASIVLIMTIISSLLGFQFIVTELQKNEAAITKKARVAYSFLVAWLSFLAGCILLLVSIFKVN